MIHVAFINAEVNNVYFDSIPKFPRKMLIFLCNTTLNPFMDHIGAIEVPPHLSRSGLFLVHDFIE